jgi:hypothetical protein
VLSQTPPQIQGRCKMKEFCMLQVILYYLLMAV